VLLSLPCRSVWAEARRPATPAELLAALPDEARQAKALGAGALEFPGDLCVVAEGYAGPVWERVAEVLTAAGLAATVHLPWVWVDLAALDRHVWEGSVRSAEAAAAALQPLAPRLAALHPANYATGALLRAAPAAAQTEVLLAMGERLTEAVARLRQGPLGGVLGLENLEGIPLDLFRFVAAQADVGVCFDVGHALSDGHDPVAAVTALRDRLVGVHLHDARPGQAHLPLGDGQLDLAAWTALELPVPVVLELEGDVAPSVARLLGHARPPGR
jgi:sugar phosphate isomerase/epimerase